MSSAVDRLNKAIAENFATNHNALDTLAFCVGFLLDEIDLLTGQVELLKERLNLIQGDGK